MCMSAPSSIPAAGLLVLLALGGCAAGPNFHRPKAPAVSHYTQQPSDPATTVTAGGTAQRIDPALEAKQVERVRALRAKRDPGPWKAASAGLEHAARSGANVMPRILAAVEASATVGEISDAMRRVFGEYKEAVVI